MWFFAIRASHSDKLLSRFAIHNKTLCSILLQTGKPTEQCPWSITILVHSIYKFKLDLLISSLVQKSSEKCCKSLPWQRFPDTYKW